MRVMVDANVLLSAIVFRSVNMLRVLGHASSEGNEFFASSWTIDEVRAVVCRKWPKRPSSVDALLYAAKEGDVRASELFRRGCLDCSGRSILCTRTRNE